MAKTHDENIYRAAQLLARLFHHSGQTPLSLAIWRGIFDDSELCEFGTLPKESLEDALQRHRRKLEAMLQALEEINLPELDWLPPKVRQQLEM